MPDPATVAAFLEPRHAELAAAASAFAGAEIATLEPCLDDDTARRQARRIVELLGAGGWCGHAIAAEWGGSDHGPDFRACCLIREALAAASPLADSVFALQCLGSLPISLAASDEVRRRFLPEVAAGRALAAFAMTEPDAGSDVAAIKT
ncbi:MAG: acyl-CoA dehydrogenase family protein, partial [Thermoanaerobaculia bacterium]